VDLEVYIGQRSAEIIKNNSIYTHPDNFYSFILKNIDATDTALGANIHVHVQRQPGG